MFTKTGIPQCEKFCEGELAAALRAYVCGDEDLLAFMKIAS